VPISNCRGGREKVWTIEGLSRTPGEDIHFIQRAFLEEGLSSVDIARLE
jgi:aerobic-type carbon monoxide dehydrogenase small subunit (CoxS/CutS family)